MKANLYIEAIATITSLGIGKEKAFQNLQLKPSIKSFKINDTLEFPTSQISEFQNNSLYDKAFLFADKALNEIELQIKVKLNELNKTAILVGCTKGESFSISHQLQKKEPDFQTYLAASSNLINTKLSQKYQLPFIPVSSAACATGSQVIQKAALLLEENKFEKILLCMTEASLTTEMIGAFSQLGVLTKEPNGTAPFDSNHQGFHMGEGAVALLLSKKKSNNNQGEILGAISTTDANHFTTFPNGPQLVWESIQKLCFSC
jgi:3-oxoacyl-(acyl-carrier-protein) synthase